MLADTEVLTPWTTLCLPPHPPTPAGSRITQTTTALSLLSGDMWACFYTFILNKEAA